MKTYKVWIHIEEYDSETDEYSDDSHGILPDCLGEFDTVEKANDLKDELYKTYGENN